MHAVDGPEAFRAHGKALQSWRQTHVNWQCIHSAFPTSIHEIPTPRETEHHVPLNDVSLLRVNIFYK